MAAVWRQETRHARRGTLWMLLTGALILLAITGRNPKHYQVADAIETAALLGSATVLLVPWIRHWVAVLRARDLETTRDTRSLLLKRLTRNVDLAELAQKVDSNQRRIDAFEQAWSILAPDEPEDVRPPKPRFHVLQGGENADSRDAG